MTETKDCRKCKLIKNKTEFTKDKTRVDGLDRICKSCKKEYRLLADKDALKEYYREYRKNNIDKIKNQLIETPAFNHFYDIFII